MASEPGSDREAEADETMVERRHPTPRPTAGPSEESAIKTIFAVMLLCMVLACVAAVVLPLR